MNQYRVMLIDGPRAGSLITVDALDGPPKRLFVDELAWKCCAPPDHKDAGIDSPAVIHKRFEYALQESPDAIPTYSLVKDIDT